MKPRFRASTSSSSSLSAIIYISNFCSFICCLIRFTIICISSWLKSIFQTPQHHSSPFKYSHKMPSSSFISTITTSIIKIYINFWILPRQTTSTIIYNTCLKCPDKYFCFFNSIYQKGWMPSATKVTIYIF